MKTKYQKFLEKAALFRADVLFEFDAGKSQAEVARKFNVSRARVCQIIKARQPIDTQPEQA